MNNTLVYQAPPEARDERLDRFLAARAGDLSRARIKNLIDQGFCSVDGVKAKAGQKIKAGQSVILVVPEPEQTELAPDPNVEFGIIFQDKDIVVIDKPPGLVVHPAAGHGSGTLVNGLLAACPDIEGIGGEVRPGIVHRLDKDTSGVMIAAKNDRAHRALVEAFKERTIEKSYLALCTGAPRKRKGEVDLPIGRHPVRRKEMSTRSRSGRPAVTRYEVIKYWSVGVCLVRLHILTGRTHQIRVHMSAIGLPVLGDGVYGKGAAGLKAGGGEIKGLVKRQMLHSHRLGLAHPFSGREMEFEAPPAPDMKTVLDKLDQAYA